MWNEARIPTNLTLKPFGSSSEPTSANQSNLKNEKEGLTFT
jgi:hypothetical protein